MVVGLLMFCAAAVAQAQTAANVLLVLNEASPVSLEIGQYYAQKRGVPQGNIVRVKVPVDDEISRQVYERGIESPVAGWFGANSGHDRILYIVLTKGIPLRISGSSGPEGTTASVDSELALLYRKMAAQPFPAAGRVRNPYFLGDAPLSQAKQFSHELQEIYLVTRLDGYTGAEVRALIDRGFAPLKEGKIVLDEKQSAQDKGNVWLRGAAEKLRALGFGDWVVHDGTEKVLSDIQGVLGYYSWGSNDPAIKSRNLRLGFVPGALAGMFVSSDARTFNEPPASWNIGTWEDKATYFAGSPQSLAGDLIRAGVTGIAGHVAEPFLESTIRPDILFPAYVSGFNLAEAYYLAMPFLSWQTVVVGDPLCAPFRMSSLSSQQIDKGIDEGTELPAYFGPRRMQASSVTAYQKAQVHPDTTRLLIRAEVRVAKGDFAGARRILEDATSRDSRIISAQLTLASLYEQAHEYDKAIERYQLMLRMNPGNPIALNNLAYALAVRKNSPQEALPMAEKAYAASQGNASIADTLGWIHHLLGDEQKAKTYLEQALKGSQENGELHFHAAVVYSALGEQLAAAAELERALQADPTLAEREDVRALQSKLR